MKTKLYLILFLSLFLSSCSTTVKLAPCVTKYTTDVVMRWGEMNKNNYQLYYELTTDKNITFTVNNGISGENKKEKIGKIPDEVYCNLLKKAKEYILKTQALNSPGETSNFFEYIDKKNNTQFKAIWNPEFTNKGNQDFKELYKELQEALKQAEQ
ncbi:MAG: hypothetical protein ACPL1A_09060 [Candidatus Kapaibacteriota bacterium]